MKRHTCQQNAFSVRDTHNNKPNRTVYMSPTTTNQTTQCTCHPQQRNKLYSIDLSSDIGVIQPHNCVRICVHWLIPRW